MTTVPPFPAGPGAPHYPSAKSGADGAPESATPATGPDGGATGQKQDPVPATQTASLLQSADQVWAQVATPASVSLDAERGAEKARVSALDVQTQASLAALAQSSQLPNDLLDLLKG